MMAGCAEAQDNNPVLNGLVLHAINQIGSTSNRSALYVFQEPKSHGAVDKVEGPDGKLGHTGALRDHRRLRRLYGE